MQQGGHPNYQQNWQGDIQQQQQQPPPVYQQHGNQYQQHQQQHHHQQGVQYQFDMATVVANQQRGQPQQQIMHVPNTLLGVHQAQHQQHNQQQQQQHQMMSAQQQQQQMVSHYQHYSMIYNALESDGLKRIYRREIRSLIYFTCLEASGEWKRIWYQYGIALIRDGVDANSCNLMEGTDIVQPKYVSGGNSDILPECYDESYTKYVSNSELGKRYLRLFSSILGTDEWQQQKQKRQRVEQKLQQQDQSVLVAEQEIEGSRLTLKLAEQQLIKDQRLHKQQLDVRSELELQLQQNSKEKESGLTISIEEDQDDEIVDKANELLMSLSLQGGTTALEQDEYDMKIIRQMCSKVMNRRINRLSDKFEREQRKERKLLDAKAKSKEECIHCLSRVKAAEEHHKLVVKANLASYRQVAAEVELEMETTRYTNTALINRYIQPPSHPPTKEQSPDHGQTPEQMAKVNDMVDAIMATDATELNSYTKLTKEGQPSLHGQPEEPEHEQMAKVNDMVDAIMATDATELNSYTKLTKAALPLPKLTKATLPLPKLTKTTLPKLTKPKELSQNVTQLSLRFVQIDSDRCPLPAANRKEITNTLIHRLSSLVVDEYNNVKGAFQLSYRFPRSGESNIINVYGIPLDRLSSVDDDDFFNTQTFVDQRAFAKQNQVTLSLPEVQAVSAIKQASSSDEPPISALQQILNDTYHENTAKRIQQLLGSYRPTLPSQGERRQLFFFKGVVYFVWIDAPLEVLEMLKETCKDVYEDVRAVKIGESGEDLIQHLKKMKNLLTHLAGAKLCWIAIGIPFGLCTSRMVEQWIHFIKLELRKSGEWHSRKVLSLETIKHILKRTGGKVICRGTVSHGGQSGDGTVNTRGVKDGAGWIYFFRQLFTEEELRELWKIYCKLSEGEGKHFIRFLLAFKVGASRENDPEERPRANFWAMVRGRGEFAAFTGSPKVFEQEAYLHKQLREKQVCGERFMLVDADGNSEIESFLKLLRNNAQYKVVEGKLHREHEKLNYLEGETIEWIRRDLISLVEFVDMIMKGVVREVTYKDS